MKKLFIPILLALLAFVLVSCDLQAQLESVSDMVYNAATSFAGPYLRETEFHESSEADSSERPSETSSPSQSAEQSSQISSTEPEPKPEPEPEPIPIPEREPSTFDEMMGINVNFVLPNSKTDPVYVYGTDYRFFSFVRAYKNFSEGESEDDSTMLGRAETMYKSRTMLSLDIDFSILCENEQAGYVSYLELAKSVYGYASRHKDIFAGSTDHIEIGLYPDLGCDPYVYARLLSLCYDGNEGEYAATDEVGVINANSDAKLTLGALSRPDAGYVKSVMEALDALRQDGGVLTVGAISTDAYAPASKTPEEFYLTEGSDLLQLLEYRNTYYGHVQVIISAFGYNTVDTGSEFYVDEQTQADYLVRSFLIFSSLDIESAMLPIFMDDASSEHNGFGVIDADGNAKTAQNYLYALKQIMSGMSFAYEIEVGDGAYRYCFEDVDGNRVIAVWSPDGSDIENALVEVGDADVTLATLDGDEAQVVTPVDGKITVTASSTPKFIIINK